jgi:hypothetical protein
MDQSNIQNAYKSLVRKHSGARANQVRNLGQEANNLRLLPVETNIDDMTLREMLVYLRSKILSKDSVMKIQIEVWANNLRAWS